jgi:putative tributyrin esterase
MSIPVTVPDGLRLGAYHSHALGREQPYAYMLPTSAGEDAERRYPLLLLLHGLAGNHLDWPTQTRLARYAAAYDLCIAFPEGGTGWYTNAYDGTADYEDDLVQCLLPHLQGTLPLLPPGRQWAIGGLSMGGYGAVKIALRHPRLFSLAVSHSGAFGMARSREPHPIFGDPDADVPLRRQCNVFSLAEDALSRWPTERPRLYFDCGTEDELLGINRRLHEHLNFIGYQHQYTEMPGYHTWPYWDRAIRTALPTIAATLGCRPVVAEQPEHESV